MENITNVINEKKFTNHKLNLDNRKNLSLTGVEKAISSNDTELILQVVGTKLYINGNNLHIEKLDVESGIVEIDGEIDQIKYGVANKKNFMKRIFK